MFVEYMALKDRKEAIDFFDAGTKIKPDEKDEIYLVKENNSYQAVLKIKKGKKYREQKWFLELNEKGVKAKREMTNEYGVELIMTIASAVLCLLFLAVAFVWQQMMPVFIWLALVAFFSLLFVSWRKFFKPSVSLKIFLIRIL